MTELNRVIHGDFRDTVFPSDAFFFSDPPYNQNYHYDAYGDNFEEKEYIDLLNSAFKGKKCVIIHYPEETINLLSQIGRCEQVVSWVYNSNTAKQHRLISWWNCKPDFSKIKQPYKNLEDKRILERIENGSEGTNLYDWWEIDQIKNVSQEKTDHPCQIPLEVMKRIVLLTTEEGDTVVDPFTGSGTTLVAAKQLKRNYIGAEMSEAYCKIAESRLAQDILFV